MTNIFLYLVESSFVFSILYGIYKIGYSKTTFYSFNRWILLIIPIVSFIVPLANTFTSKISTTPSFIKIPDFQEFIHKGEELLTQSDDMETTVYFSFEALFSVVYFLGLALLLIKLVQSILVIVKLKKESPSFTEEKVRFILTDKKDTFSFFNWIFISKEHQAIDNTLIITHEKAHILFKHTIDILFIELYILFFWFNPFVYSYRKSLKAIHEYQADAYVLNKDVKKSTYLYALLENIQIVTSNNLYNYFNQPVIKKRIDMITKNPTNKMYKLSYSILGVSTLLLCFAFTKANKAALNPKLHYTTTHFTTPPFLFPVQNKSRKDISSIYGQKGRYSKKTGKKLHQGIDIKAPIGTPVVATADGVIMKASNQKAWGNLIVINHADGYQTWYAHLDGFNAKENQTVKRGQIIGYVGNTGFSTGPHLHYEVRLNDKHLDPLDVIEE
ncbi:BlaR1 peptidase M56 [Tenacibaculum sp. 190130A14a]|uniref:Peptidoglycan LD-endopeptidase LytH n=1 Tax=Tenacibaculum polynesiense TaxID=3137857 RepID=A0ABP1F084_9FLAO